MSFSRLAKSGPHWLSLTFAVLTLTACEQLGLDDDDKSRPVVIDEERPPLPLIVPEPVVDFPVTKSITFRGENFNDPDNPLDQSYSFLTEQKSVLTQGSSLETQTEGLVIPLGRDRFTSGYAVIYSDERFFLAQPETAVINQISTFDGEICNYRVIARGVGLENADIVVRSPGADFSCNTIDDPVERISLASDTVDTPETASPVLLTGTPVYGPDWTLDGLMKADGNDLVFTNPGGGPSNPRVFSGAFDGTFPELIRVEDRIVLAIDRDLYFLRSEELVDAGVSVQPIAQFTSSDLQLSVSDSTAIVLDGTTLIETDLRTSAQAVLADLSGLALDALQVTATRNNLFFRSSDGGFYRVARDGSAAEELLGSTTASFEIINGIAYVNGVLADGTFVARQFAESVESVPLCAGEAGVTVDQTGCRSFAQWWLMDRFGDEGRDRIALLAQGNETQINQGATVIVLPPQDGIYLNAIDLSWFNPVTGEESVVMGSLRGYSRLEQRGVIENQKGTLTLVTLDDGIEERPDFHFFDLTQARSFRLARRTPQIAEELLVESED